VYPQFLDNKTNIYIGGNYGFSHGKSMVVEESFVYPSLYSNYKDIKGISIKVLYKNNQLYSLGLSFNNLLASEWENQEYLNYSKSLNNMYTLCPTIQLHNKHNEIGIFNRLKGLIEVSPVIGLSKLSLNKNLFDIRSNSNTVSQPMASNNFFFGIKGGIGFELSVTKIFGIYLMYNMGHNWLSSKLYFDKSFYFSTFDFGLVVRFEKDKFIYY
jgi:hypothetical protein